jgi:uncharacterized membrane protein
MLMRTLRLLLRHETVAPMLAMIFATALCSMLVLARVIAADTLRDGLVKHAYLIWNLFLAWLPLIFALLACEEWKDGTKRNWRFIGFAAGWLLFAPNAPYIFTDLVHISVMFTKHYWVDLAMILACALTGLMLWFVSLYLMQAIVAKKFGGATGWGFVAAMAGLSSLGIYLGRFARFNSWDVVTKPTEVYQGVSSWATSAMSNKPNMAFAISFAGFLFIAYLMLYALTHLSPAKLAPATQAAEK